MQEETPTFQHCLQMSQERAVVLTSDNVRTPGDVKPRNLGFERGTESLDLRPCIQGHVFAKASCTNLVRGADTVACWQVNASQAGAHL